MKPSSSLGVGYSISYPGIDFPVAHSGESGRDGRFDALGPRILSANERRAETSSSASDVTWRPSCYWNPSARDTALQLPWQPIRRVQLGESAIRSCNDSRKIQGKQTLCCSCHAGLLCRLNLDS